MSDRMWAVMVEDAGYWEVYCLDTSREYVDSVAVEIRENGGKAGIMEIEG
jgi:hypothetical protein